MIKHAIEWRQSVLGVGIDEIYRRTDPYDVRTIVLNKECSG